MTGPSLDADGVLVVDKPSGPTSHDVVKTARRALGPRIGHTGTLDPLASGVLPLVVGRATRLAQFMSGAEKTYEAAIVFGRETDTYDAAGRTTAETGRVPEPSALAEAVAALPGRIRQTPPVYSAKKIGGQPSHRLARRDAPVVPADIDVEILETELLAFDGREARMRLRVSAGFYVRSLAHDLGVRFGVGAHLGALRRTRAGAFGLDGAVDWPAVVAGGAGLRAALVPLGSLLRHLPAAWLGDEAVARVRHGRPVTATIEPPRPDDVREAGHGTAPPAGVRLLDASGQLVAIAASPTAEAAQDGRGTAEEGLIGTLRPIVVLG